MCRALHMSMHVVDAREKPVRGGQAKTKPTPPLRGAAFVLNTPHC
jgi:hypothetical protein